MYTKINLQKYESFLSSLRLQPELHKIKTVEIDLKGDLNPTNMLDYLFFKINHWVSFDDFFNYYLSKNEEKLKSLCKDNDWDKFKEGLKARLYRTLIGFLTEYHAFYMAKTIFGDENVKRSPELDKTGIDFQIFYCFVE